MDVWQTAKNSALRRAFEARNRLSISRNDPLNVFDACHRIGIEVRFLDAKSLEGMYCRAPRLSIFLPSSKHRPRGRIAFSCAHELGHHELGHGTHADEYVADSHNRSRREPEELAADVFAAHFLMPRQAVLRAARLRDWDLTTLQPKQALTLAGFFGVGYESLLWQLSNGLQLLPPEQFSALSKVGPKSLRGEIYQAAADTNLLILDRAWRTVPADLEVGDFLLTSIDAATQSPILESAGGNGEHRIWLAREVGHAQIHHAGGTVSVRVSRRGYVGSWRNRFLVEEED